MFGNVTAFAFTVRRSAAALPIVVLPFTVRLPLADKDVPLIEELDPIEPVTVRLFDMTVAPVTLRVLLIVNGLENDTFPKNDAFPLHVKVELNVTDEAVRLPAIEFDEAELVCVMLPNTDRLPALVEMFPVAASDESVVAPVTARVDERVVAPVTVRVDERLVAPVTPSVEPMVANPETARLEASPVAPVTFRVPTMLAAVVESWSAESVPPPSLMLLRLPVRLALSEVLSRPMYVDATELPVSGVAILFLR
jgi:hypothetical protein